MLYHFSFFSCLWCVYRFKHFHFHSNSLFYGHETTTKKKIQILYTPIDNFDLIYFRHWMICIHLMIRFLVWPVSSFVSCCFFFFRLFVCSPTEHNNNQPISHLCFVLFFVSVEFEFGIYIYMYNSFHFAN